MDFPAKTKALLREAARRYVSIGRARGRPEGEARGRAELVLKQLTLRFGPLPDVTVQRVRAATIAELDAFAERVLGAKNLDEVLVPASDLVLASLSGAARKALQAMDPAKYEYQSEFARRYVSQGRAEMVLKLLTLRFGRLPAEAEARVRAASIEQLDAVAERVLSAKSLDEVLG